MTMKIGRRFLLPALLGGLFASQLPARSAHAQAPAAPAAPAAQAPAAAAETADQLLGRVDGGNSSFKDAIFEFKMIIKESSGPREVAFLTKQKGSEKRLVLFLAPADIQGMGFLIESADVMYARLPQFADRVRRIATHQMGGNFMGSDMSSEDMAIAKYSAAYTPKVVGTENGKTVLELTLKPGQKASSTRLKMWVEPTKALISQIEYYDAAGKKTRTQIREDYRPDSPNHMSPFLLRFIDHVRNNHETELRLQKSQLDTGLGDDIFTVRSLKKS